MSKRNENRKGYKRTPLGWIPKEWEVEPLRRYINLVNGMAFKPKDWGVDGLPIIRIQNLNDSEAQFNYYNGTVEERYYVNKGDLLFAWSGTKGVSFGIRVWDKHKAILNQHIFRVIPNEKKIDKTFAFYSLKKAQGDIESRAHGFKSSFVHVKKGDLEKTIIAIPKISEQQKIATILSTWDEAISQTQQLLEQLKTRNQGLMQKLLTGKRRLKGFSGKWDRKALNQFLKKHDEKTISNNQYPVLTSSREGLFLQKDYYNGREVASSDNTGYNVVPRGFFTYRHMSDDLVFRFNINNLVDKGIVSTLYPVFDTTKDLDKYYLQNVLNHGREFKHFALEQKQGGSRTYMYFSKLVELKISIPTIEEQLAIRDAIETCANEVAIYDSKLTQLQLQKKGLMQKLLTGEVRAKT